MSTFRRLWILLVLFAGSGLLFPQAVEFSRPPGTYSRSFRLTLAAADGARLYYQFGPEQEDALLPYRFPLHLSALSGEERSYRLFLYQSPEEGVFEDLGVYEYRIDKRLPDPPQPSLPSGLYDGSIEISFAEGSDRIVYSLDGNIAEEPEIYTGTPLRLSAREAPYTLYSYSRDSAGNVSPLTTREYTLRSAPGRGDGSFEVLSPVEGHFLNRQFLYLRIAGLDRVLYTIDGSDPKLNGLRYDRGVILDRSGDIELRMVGRFPDGSFTPEKRVVFSVSAAPPLTGVAESGIYEKARSFNLNNPALRYTFEERLASTDDLSGREAITLFPSPRGLTHYSLRVRDTGREGSTQYRFYYVFDNRTPGEPSISIEGEPPYAASPLVSVSYPGYARLYYSLDGRSPTEESRLYTAPFRPELPDGSGSILLKVVAFGLNGRRGAESGELIPYDSIPPVEPRIEMLQQTEADSPLLKIQVPSDAEAVFEISLGGAEAPLPDQNSPRWLNEAITLPWGMESEISLRFASRDAAGNLSPSVAKRLRIDRRPPDSPRIVREGDAFSLIGEGSLFYRIVRPGQDGAAPRGENGEADPEYLTYSEPIVLADETGKLLRYRVDAYAEDTAGNRSEISTLLTERDDRLPELPFISGIEDRAVYSAAQLSPRFSSTEKDFDLLYTLGTEDEEPPAPDLGSASLRDLVIDTEAGREVYYHLKLLPVFPAEGRAGRVHSLRFIVDRKPPVLPRIEGMPAGGVSSRDLYLKLSGLPDDETAYYQLRREADQPVDPVRYGQAYAEAISLEAGPGEEASYLLNLAVVDKAGNRSDDGNTYAVQIDKLPPQLPVPAGLPDTGVSTAGVSVSFSTSPDVTVEYRVLPEEELKRAAEIPFTEYREPITLSGTSGEARLYHLEYRGRDRAGNLSRQTAQRQISIDSRPIQQPPEPETVYRANSGIATLSWTPRSGENLYYRLNDTDPFTVYSAPITVALATGRSASTPASEPVEIWYYSESESGVRSSVHRVQLESESPRGESALTTGIENGGLYGGEAILKPLAVKRGVLRYEVSVDGELHELTSYSPVLSEEIRFNLPRGSQKDFVLQVGRFPSRGAQLPESIETIRFRIDRLPPPPPLLTELVNPDSDSPFKLIRLDGRGNRVFVRIGEERQAFDEYNDLIRLDTSGRVGETVLLAAVSEDAAGNRSRSVEWRILLDQDIIYVAERGNDLFEGTRMRPFRSLDKAFTTAEALGKGTIYIAEGRYPLRRGLVLGSDINLFGGLNAESWDPAGISVIEAGQYLTVGPLLTFKAQSELRNLRFTDSAARVRVFLVAENGALTLRNVDALSNSDFDYLLRQERGTLSIIDSVLTGVGRKGILHTANGSLIIEESELNGTAFVSGLDDGYGLVNLNGASMTLDESLILPGTGQRSVAVYAAGSYLSIKGSRLASGGGSRLAAAIILNDGEAIFDDAQLEVEHEAGTGLALRARNARIAMNGGNIELAGRNGATAFLLHETDLRLEQVDIRTSVSQPPGFLFFLQQRGGSTELFNCTADLSARSEPVFADLAAGRLNLRHSTLLLSSNKGRSSGIISSGGAQLYLTNTILSNKGTLAGTALIGEARDSWSVLHSNLGGWGKVAEYNDSVMRQAGELDLSDGDPFGGWLNGNLDEVPQQTFSSVPFRLRESSACVDAGLNGNEAPDIDGQARPNPDHGIRPFPDIGADEFYAAP